MQNEKPVPSAEKL